MASTMLKCIRTQLPGGIIIDGNLCRDVLIKPVDGKLEESLALVNMHENLALAVSQIIDSAIHSISGFQWNDGLAASMCMPDRQWIMLFIARVVIGGGCWIKDNCQKCGNDFDVFIDPLELPVKLPGEGYPFVQLVIKNEAVRFRLPTGADQESIAGLGEQLAFKALLAKCLVSVDGQKVQQGYIDSLSEEDIVAIENVMEEVSPHVGTMLSTSCPECTTQAIVEIDPYRLSRHSRDDLFEEVHRIASCYHWTENEIMSLTMERRRKYLRLIERERGFGVTPGER